MAAVLALALDYLPLSEAVATPARRRLLSLPLRCDDVPCTVTAKCQLKLGPQQEPCQWYCTLDMPWRPLHFLVNRNHANRFALLALLWPTRPTTQRQREVNSALMRCRVANLSARYQHLWNHWPAAVSGLWPLYYKIKIKPRPTGNRWPGAKWCHSKNGRGLIASANKLQTTSGRRQTPKVVAIISGTLLGGLRDWQSEFVISQASFSQLLEQGMHSQVPLLSPQHVQQNVTETTMPMPMQRRCILSRRHSYL